MPWQSPIRRFVREYLVADAKADLSCAEAWQYFLEVTQAGELQPMRKSAFLRQLPTVMEAVFNARKAHNVERSGRRQRGFRGVGVRLDTSEPLVVS